MPTAQSNIEPMIFDPPMLFSVTLNELVEICKESRQSHFSFVLDDSEIAGIPADRPIEVSSPWLHTNFRGDQNVRLAVQFGRNDSVLDVSLAAWEKILQNGEPEPERRPWLL